MNINNFKNNSYTFLNSVCLGYEAVRSLMSWCELWSLWALFECVTRCVFLVFSTAVDKCISMWSDLCGHVSNGLLILWYTYEKFIILGLNFFAIIEIRFHWYYGVLKRIESMLRDPINDQVYLSDIFNSIIFKNNC